MGTSTVELFPPPPMVIMARPSNTVKLRMDSNASSYTTTNTQPPHDP